MDDQHGILLDTINELRQALMRGCGREEISEILDRLIEYTRMHFWSEEQLMEQAGFADLAEHRAEHHAILADMLQWAHRLQYGNGIHMPALLVRLKEGFFEHIEQMDSHYGECLNEKGIQ